MHVWRDAEEVAAVAAVGFGCCVDDLDDLGAFSVEADLGRPELAVVVLGAELGVCRLEEALPAEPLEREAAQFLVVDPLAAGSCSLTPGISARRPHSPP